MKKTIRVPRSGASKRAVFYRGVEIIPMKGKRSPLARIIHDGLQLKSEPPHDETVPA